MRKNRFVQNRPGFAGEKREKKEGDTSGEKKIGLFGKRTGERGEKKKAQGKKAGNHVVIGGKKGGKGILSGKKKVFWKGKNVRVPKKSFLSRTPLIRAPGGGKSSREDLLRENFFYRGLQEEKKTPPPRKRRFPPRGGKK